MKASVDRIKEYMYDNEILNIFIIDKVTVPSFTVLDPNVHICSLRYDKKFTMDQPKYEEHLCEVMGEYLDNKDTPNLFVVKDYDNLYIFKDYEIEDMSNYASDLYIVNGYLYDIWAEKFFNKHNSEILINEIKSGEFEYDEYDDAFEYALEYVNNL